LVVLYEAYHDARSLEHKVSWYKHMLSKVKEVGRIFAKNLK